MQTHTGSLMDTSLMPEETLKSLQSEGYEKVPNELQEEATKQLDGKKETKVDLEGDSDLAKWAKEKRAEQDRENGQKARNEHKKRKKRNKAQRSSRKKGRR